MTQLAPPFKPCHGTGAGIKAEFSILSQANAESCQNLAVTGIFRGAKSSAMQN